MFNAGDTVTVTVDWLPVAEGSEGEVLGEVFRNPVSYLVRFSTGTYPIPLVHLSTEAKRKARTVRRVDLGSTTTPKVTARPATRRAPWGR
jgi:hypothetical protein